MTRTILWCGTVVIAMAAGCSQEKPAGKPGATATAQPVAASPYLLTAEPAGAKPVVEVRKAAKDGDEVVAVGRVGGTEKPIDDGDAAFMIVDPKLKPCADGCPTPWDYCCAQGLDDATAMVRMVDAKGQTVTTDAKTLLGIKELSEVVVRGKVKRDDKGDLTILAQGVYVRK